VKFTFSGPADYTLDVTASFAGIRYFPGSSPYVPGPNAVGETPILGASRNALANYRFALVDRVQTLPGYSNPTALAVALGEVGAHEAGHYLLHIADSPNNIGIMAPTINGPGWYPAFSGGQAVQLRDKCGKLHPPASSPKPAGGAGGSAGLPTVTWGWTFGSPGFPGAPGTLGSIRPFAIRVRRTTGSVSVTQTICSPGVNASANSDLVMVGTRRP
jgi:hypothetical protein